MFDIPDFITVLFRQVVLHPPPPPPPQKNLFPSDIVHSVVYHCGILAIAVAVDLHC